MKENKKHLEQEMISCRAEIALLKKQLSEEKATSAQLRESRKNLIAIFDGFPEPLFLLDLKTRIKMLNRAATSYCQTDYVEAIGKKYADICTVEKQHSGDYSVVDTIREGKELTFTRNNGAHPERIELLTLLPLSDANNETKRVIFRIQDVTEQEKMNEQLVLADRLASLSQLSSGVSHEIRNPLASIMLYVDIFADPKRFSRSEEELEILDDIKENIQKITDIITRIFDFTRFNSPNRASSDINKLIEDIFKLWVPKMKRTGIETELSLDVDLPHVSGDSVELQQVFSNLILNAIEAMADGGKISITTSTADSTYSKDRKIVFVTVKDSGTGIPDDLRQIVFNPFFSTKTDHTGLGLTISYQIVKRHGGILSCKKSDVEGSIFTIEFPMEEKLNNEERELL